MLKRYDVVQIGNTVKLIYPVAEGSSSIKYYVQKEDIFDVIHDAHLAIGHGGRNRMIKETQTKYKNITAESIMLYLSLCVPCLKKSKVPKKGLVIKPMIFSEMNSRAQVDLIDMQSQPDGDLKWILVYQDHLIKFVQLHPVTSSKRAPEIAYQLLDIFSIFGAPSILQSDNVAIDYIFTEEELEKTISGQNGQNDPTEDPTVEENDLPDITDAEWSVLEL